MLGSVELLDARALRFRVGAPLGAGAHNDAAFPFDCPPGVLGASHEPLKQTTPQCSGACPEGWMCPGATATPLPCSLGAYCPRGSAALRRSEVRAAKHRPPA